MSCHPMLSYPILYYPLRTVNIFRADYITLRIKIYVVYKTLDVTPLTLPQGENTKKND